MNDDLPAPGRDAPDAAPEPPAAGRLPYWPWVVAWLVGFGVMSFYYGPEAMELPMPAWLPLATLHAVLAGAAVVSAVLVARRPGREGVVSWARGVRYAVAFVLSLAVLAAAVYEIIPDLPDTSIVLLSSAGTVALVSAGHMLAGALWPDRRLFRLGLWTTFVNFVGLLAGIYSHAPTMVLLGVGGLVLAALARRLFRLATSTTRGARRGGRRRAVRPDRVAVRPAGG